MMMMMMISRDFNAHATGKQLKQAPAFRLARLRRNLSRWLQAEQIPGLNPVFRPPFCLLCGCLRGYCQLAAGQGLK